MPWDRVVGQQRAVETLRRAVATDSVSQAYLFHGPEGVGKRVAALMLAQALQCERRASGSGEACGECLPCSKVARMIHPDVRLYLAQPKKTSEEDVTPRLAALVEDPYREVGFLRRPSMDDPTKTTSTKPFYEIDRVRDITRQLRYAPSEGRATVAILTEAHTMRPDAQSALLKSLEEPIPNTTLILTADRPDSLLPTIVSRCQRLRFEPLAPEEIEQALVDRQAAGLEEARMFARMADGSLTRALSLVEHPDLAQRREQVLMFFRFAYQNDIDGLDALSAELAKLGRPALKDVLSLMLTWVRDLALARTIPGDPPIVNVDQADSIRKFVAHVQDARLDDLASQIEHAMYLLDRNVHVNLLLTVLGDAAHDAIRGRERPRLFEPLAS